MIGTTYGSGNETTTFNLPDMREAVPVGVGQRESGVTAHDAYELGQFKDDQFQGHRHDRNNEFLARAYEDAPFDYQSLQGDSLDANYTKNSGFILDPIADVANGTPRTGATTHGKQIDINYIICYI